MSAMIDILKPLLERSSEWSFDDLRYCIKHKNGIHLYVIQGKKHMEIWKPKKTILSNEEKSALWPLAVKCIEHADEKKKG